jgi:hypothetical protein
MSTDHQATLAIAGHEAGRWAIYYVVRSSAPRRRWRLGRELRHMAGSGVPKVALRADAEHFERLAALDRAVETEAGPTALCL